MTATVTSWRPSTPLGLAVYAAGFEYDPDQQIIYSRMDALQRHFGYAFGYDRSIFLISALIDCEPIFFDYDGKHWMIELWKGQYGLETGCEIGVYTRPIGSENPVYHLLDATVGRRDGDSVPSHNLFYDCASDADRLKLELTLYRDGRRLFSRGPETHWWLTGFQWGVLSEPAELSVELSITLKDDRMCQAFLGGIEGRPYPNLEVHGTTVSFTFERPFTPQPRIDPVIVQQVERANAAVVSAYHALNPPDNDPNHVQATFLEVAGLSALRVADLFGRVVAQLAAELGRDVPTVVSALVQGFGVAAQTVEAWISGAIQNFADWVSAIERYLGLPLDFSCYVEIDNSAGTSDLILEEQSASEGSYAVPPPQWIPRGETARFVLRDPKPSPHGSDGSVRYRYCDANLATRTVTFAYECPTGLVHNAASASQSGWQLLAKTDDVRQPWSGTVPHWGRPLYVDFVARP